MDKIFTTSYIPDTHYLSHVGSCLVHTEYLLLSLNPVFQISMSACCTPVSVKNRLNVWTHLACTSAGVPRDSSTTSPPGPATVRPFSPCLYKIKNDLIGTTLHHSSGTTIYCKSQIFSNIPVVTPLFLIGCCRCGWMQDGRVWKDLSQHRGQLQVSVWRPWRFSFGRRWAKLRTYPRLCAAGRLQTPRDALPGGAVCRTSCHLPALPPARKYKVRVYGFLVGVRRNIGQPINRRRFPDFWEIVDRPILR